MNGDSDEVWEEKLKVSDAKALPSTLELDSSSLNEDWDLWRKWMDESLSPNFSSCEGKNEAGLEADGWKESNEDKILMKDLDPFFLSKMSSTFLSFAFPLRIEILFFRLTMFFSSEVVIKDEGNSHESR